MARRKRNIFAVFEQMMGMDEAAWQRHANPWSVYSRMTILPLMTLAICARVWLGWGAVVPVALVCVWTWWNPRAFEAPTRTDTWASRVTFGERVLLNRHAIAVPAHHHQWAQALGGVAGIGLPFWIWGMWQLDLGMTLFGLALLFGGKLWMCDRMVWLYQDMKDTDPAYAGWLR